MGQQRQWGFCMQLDGPARTAPHPAALHRAWRSTSIRVQGQVTLQESLARNQDSLRRHAERDAELVQHIQELQATINAGQHAATIRAEQDAHVQHQAQMREREARIYELEEQLTRNRDASTPPCCSYTLGSLAAHSAAACPAVWRCCLAMTIRCSLRTGGMLKGHYKVTGPVTRCGLDDIYVCVGGQ